jgi:predicted Zn-dependent protease
MFSIGRRFSSHRMRDTSELKTILTLSFRRAQLRGICLALICSQLFPCGSASGQTKPASSNFASLSRRAAEARDADRLDEAAALYKKALALRPSWTEGWWSLGTLLYDKDKYSEAERAFRIVVQQAPKNGTAHAMLGLCAYELGQDDKALQELAIGRHFGLLSDEQLRKVVAYHQAMLLLRRGMFVSAQEALSRSMEHGTPDEESVLAEGMAALLIKPEDLPPPGTPGREVVVRAGLAETLVVQMKSNEARAAYKSLVEEYPDYPNIHYAFGRALFEMDAPQDAVAEFQRELQLNPSHLLAKLRIAVAEYKVDSAAGLPYAEQVVKLDSGSPFGHYVLGLLLLDTGDFQGALPELEIARRSFPREPGVYSALGDAYARAGRKQEAARARATFKQLYEQSPKEPSDSLAGPRLSDLGLEKLGREAPTRPHR